MSKVAHIGNEIEPGIWIPTIGSRIVQVSRKKGIGHDVYGSTTKDLLEFTGISMAIQVPLLIICRRGVSAMSGVFPEP